MGAPRIFPANAGEGFFSSGIVDNLNFHLLHTHSAVYFKISCESEPIFGYQCVPNWTAGDSIADMVSQYRPAPEYLDVSVLQYLSIWVSPPPPVCHHRSQREHLCQSTSYQPPCYSPPPCSLSTFPFLLHGFCCLSLTPTVLYGN